MEILDSYVMKHPSQQNVIDIFAGEWSTAMPPESGLTSTPGPAPLFDTPHIRLAATLLGGFENKRVLELGPLEGAHSFMLQKGGAREVLAIEANTRSFLKCLCVKELFGLDRVHYRLGDFMAYLNETQDQFDLALACGVLYHMPDPLELLKLISKVSDRLVLWTHYYDANIINANGKLRHKFSPLQHDQRDGFKYDWVLQSYKEALEWTGFCGGGHDTSVWLTRRTILDYLSELGFAHIHTAFEIPLHPNGPSFAVVASREPLRDLTKTPQTSTIEGRFQAMITVDSVEQREVSLHIRLQPEPKQASPETTTGLYVALQLQGSLWLVTASGLVATDGSDAALPPLRHLAQTSHEFWLTLPLPSGNEQVLGIYIGFGSNLPEVIEHRAWAWVELPILNR